MRNVYVFLISSNTILSRIIRKTTKAEFTHASLSLNDEIFPCVSFGRKYSKLVLPAGFKDEPLDSGFLKDNLDINCGLFAVEVTEEQYNRLSEYIETLRTSRRKLGFNFFGLVMCKFNVLLKRKRMMFCSDFVASALNHSGITNFENTSLVRPVDLMNIPNARCIFKGRVRDVQNNI